MTDLNKTALHAKHIASGAKMVEFGGWDMPLQYSGGIVAEHLANRRSAGLFDVSHMGRFAFRGTGALDFLQHVLTNDAASLEPGQAQYTIIPNETGGAVDDAFLYRFIEEEYLLVVNASNRPKDWQHFQKIVEDFDNVEIVDRSDELAMLALQGPQSAEILAGLIEDGRLPQPKRNALSSARLAGVDVLLSRTGYTGEKLSFELFLPAANAADLWDAIVGRGASPVGLGARDTLRLEASLPLYGHEMGEDIPIFASPLARSAVSFSADKGNYIGVDALARQRIAMETISTGGRLKAKDLPRTLSSLLVTGPGVARTGTKVLTPDADGQSHRPVGLVTSGTAVPDASADPNEKKRMRAICLALLDSDLADNAPLVVEIRGKMVEVQRSKSRRIGQS